MLEEIGSLREIKILTIRDGTASSSDGQYFCSGGRAEPSGDVNAKYGIDPDARKLWFSKVRSGLRLTGEKRARGSRQDRVRFSTPWKPSGALPEAPKMSHGRYALVGTARVATRAIEMIASTVIWPFWIACRPLLTFAQSSGPARELSRHYGGFHVRGTPSPSIIWQPLTAPNQRSSTEKRGWTTKNWPSNRRPGCFAERQHRDLPGHGRAARRRPPGFGIPGPWAVRSAHRRRQLRAHEEARRRLRPWTASRFLAACRWSDDRVSTQDGRRLLAWRRPAALCRTRC